MTNSYVETTDLEGLVNGLEIGTDGGMTVAEANALIQIIEGEVNGILFSLGIDAPIISASSPKAYGIIKSMVTWGVMALSMASLHSLLDDTEGSREASFWRRYDRARTLLIDTGGASLADALTFTNLSERNGAPTFSNQFGNVDLYVGLRDLTLIRDRDNRVAVSRLYRPLSRNRTFDGSPY